MTQWGSWFIRGIPNHLHSPTVLISHFRMFACRSCDLAWWFFLHFTLTRTVQLSHVVLPDPIPLFDCNFRGIFSLFTCANASPHSSLIAFAYVDYVCELFALRIIRWWPNEPILWTRSGWTNLVLELCMHHYSFFPYLIDWVFASCFHVSLEFEFSFF